MHVLDELCSNYHYPPATQSSLEDDSPRRNVTPYFDPSRIKDSSPKDNTTLIFGDPIISIRQIQIIVCLQHQICWSINLLCSNTKFD